MKSSNRTHSSKPNNELNEYAAAARVGLSPKLLRWFARHAPKQGSNRKLKVREEGGRLFVDREELDGFDDWLKLPWPSTGTRPPIPAGIRREIREEASGECAMCRSNGNSCEAAHIDPVAKSKNNHPENLIWLCANHHTKFDKGLFGPSSDSKDFVDAFKQSLIFYRRGLWELQAEVTGRLFTMLKACDNLNSQLASATTPDQVAAIKHLAKMAIGKVAKMAPTSKQDPDYEAFTELKPQFEALTKKTGKRRKIKDTLALASKFKTEFAQRAGYEACPLCEGKGRYKSEDCPACNGEGELPKDQIYKLDLDRYAMATCPLCKGDGVFDGDDCPACGGDGELERRYSEQIDPHDWSQVSCNLCEGTGRWNGEDCPVCNGEGTLERHQRDQVDLRAYDLVDCPLCDGMGVFNGEDCPECHGDRQIQRRYAEQIDLRAYDLVDCPLCDGMGVFNGEDCPECHGDRQIDRRYAEQIDLSAYDLVDCPLCDGTGAFNGEDCPGCHGDRQIDRRYAEQIDLSAYDQVDCPLCDGTGAFNGEDCPKCQGDRQILRRHADNF